MGREKRVTVKKAKKGFLNIIGNNFLITEFDNEKIIIKGTIVSVEFCI